MIATVSVLIAIAFVSPNDGDRDEPAAAPWLREAEGSCRAHDFTGFFESFVRSPEVRRRYSAPVIDVRPVANPASPGRRMPVKLEDFDIALIDYTYADAGSVRRRETRGTPFIALSIKQKALPGGRWRVDYQPAVLDYDGEGIGRPFGKRRAYVFAPYRGCWRLERHLR